MESRLEKLRCIVDKMIREYQPDDDKYFYTHLYGVSDFCTLLALKRGFDPGIAAACGMLHDIYQVTDGTTKQHAVKGAETAREILVSTGLYSDDEISAITSAISRHSDKKHVHEPLDELLKDADVLHHCLYDTSVPVIKKESKRYKNLLAELGCGGMVNRFQKNIQHDT